MGRAGCTGDSSLHVTETKVWTGCTGDSSLHVTETKVWAVGLRLKATQDDGVEDLMEGDFRMYTHTEL